MQRHSHRLSGGTAPQVQVEGLREAIDARLARAVRIPAAEGVIARGADASRHCGPDGMWGKASVVSVVVVVIFVARWGGGHGG